MTLSLIVMLLSAVWLGSEIVLSRVKRAGDGGRDLDRSSLRILWIAIAVSITGGVMVGIRPIGHIPGDPVLVRIAG